MASRPDEHRLLVFAGIAEMCSTQAVYLEVRRAALTDKFLSRVGVLEETWGALGERPTTNRAQKHRVAADLHKAAEYAAREISVALCAELDAASASLSDFYTTASVLLSHIDRQAEAQVRAWPEALQSAKSQAREASSIVGALGTFGIIAWLFEETPPDSISARIAAGRAARQQALTGIIALAHAQLLAPLKAVVTNQGRSDGHP